MTSRTHVYGRTRLELALIIVCAVALFGGFSVFRTYADPQPIDLTQTGTSPFVHVYISTPKYSPNSPIYRLKTSQNATYCLVGSYSGESSITLNVSQNGTLKSYSDTFQGDSDDYEELVCFDAAQSDLAKISFKGQGYIKVTSINAARQ